jgi:hypothetical protein
MRKEEKTTMTQYDTIPTSGQEYREEIQVQGSNLADTVKELLHEGNVRRIIIRHKDRTIIEIPVTVGIVGTLLVPKLAAAGAIGALLTHSTIEVVRSDQP